ncbi:hypothetical protein [Burkholderia thailandensis]|uniref:hypothetical protein n=1 Tax=Burkholderia thailandensis TaxID=57975 RepID=UPI0021B480BB|nr:hypothetical protein [Burkholderia thailandensis]
MRRHLHVVLDARTQPVDHVVLLLSDSFTQMSGISFISVTSAESRSLPSCRGHLEDVLVVMSKSLRRKARVSRQ